MTFNVKKRKKSLCEWYRKCYNAKSTMITNKIEICWLLTNDVWNSWSLSFQLTLYLIFNFSMFASDVFRRLQRRAMSFINSIYRILIFFVLTLVLLALLNAHLSVRLICIVLIAFVSRWRRWHSCNRICEIIKMMWLFWFLIFSNYCFYKIWKVNWLYF